MHQRLVFLVIVVMVVIYISGIDCGPTKFCRLFPKKCQNIKGTLKREFGSVKVKDFRNGFTLLDTNGDGFVDGIEIAQVSKYFPGEYADWISAAYKDSYDKLTFKDFLAAARNGPSYEER